MARRKRNACLCSGRRARRGNARAESTSLPAGLGECVVYGAAIFLGAFLLFQVELILGKLILPWFGGTPAVWTACLLVFQILLLAGYAYARLFAARTFRAGGPRDQAHLVVLGSSLVLLIFLAFVWPTPITPSARLAAARCGEPDLVHRALPLGRHRASIPGPRDHGSAFAALVRVSNIRGSSPYRLYSLSNLGSLLGSTRLSVLAGTVAYACTRRSGFGRRCTRFSSGFCGVCAFRVAQLTRKRRAGLTCRQAERCGQSQLQIPRAICFGWDWLPARRYFCWQRRT